MRRVIVVDTCEGCPYYYEDKYNYLEVASGDYCDVSKKEILDIKKIPAWCKLTKYVHNKQD